MHPVYRTLTYKEVHNDVPTITTEMAEHSVWFSGDGRLRDKSVNGANDRRARKYLKLRQNIESVLAFKKQ